MPSSHAPTPLLDWDAQDRPRSLLYDDLYFSRDNGLEESRAVFLGGCDLLGAWANRAHFCVGELGFGTGLNIVALLDLWQTARPPHGRLNVFSIEAHPLTVEQAARALRPWRSVAPIAETLIARWPGAARGFHRLDMPELHATIDLAIMEVGEALSRWSGRADAWFLDGFAPALNPAMWRSEVLNLVAARSRPDARLATFTVAGAVRRGLIDAGFSLARRPGFGRKRERLEGRLAGPPLAPRPRMPRVAVIGAGIAGASLCRAFALLGVPARVFETTAAGAGASGGPAVLAAPRLDAGLGPAAALFAQAMRCAAKAYATTPRAVISHEMLQLEVGPKDSARFAAIAQSDLFEQAAMRRIDAITTSARLGEAVAAGLLIDGAVVVDPSVVLTTWLTQIEVGRVSGLQADRSGWILLGDDGAEMARADVVCVAAGMATGDLIPTIALTPVRGQASWAKGTAWPVATLFGGYVIPTRDGVMFGATHDRGDVDVAPRDADHHRNLESLRLVLPALAERLAMIDLKARTGIRATTSDYMPIAGAVRQTPALFALTGLGSRGYCLAPLLAEHVAALALGAPSPLPGDLADLIDPARFVKRARRKGRPTADDELLVEFRRGRSDQGP